jgi:dTDP-4-dehydrorhamnose 3,5-epimerase
MPEIVESSLIPGVKLVKFQIFEDARGQFMETFRKDWFPERSWNIVQGNRSESVAGVLRGLHFHRHQVDFWQVAAGSIRVGLADLRRAPGSYGRVEVVELRADAGEGLFIPPGVAHGFYALEATTLFYLVDNYYDGSDELGVAWDDPDLAIPWGTRDPIVSGRDRQNPRLADLPPANLPD